MPPEHHYRITVEWTGNLGSGTSGYRDYARTHEVRADGNTTTLPGSADPSFRGEPERWNPEELLVAALSQCHMLSYLHVAAVAGVVVTEYVDDAAGTMVTKDGGGQFTEVTLRPVVTVADAGMVNKAQELHQKAAAACFIASSVNFPVHHQPEARVATGA